MTVLMYTLGVIGFVLGLAASIGLHELGHMVPAKRFGVKVTQYFVGFGRTLWSTRRGETEYGVKAVPLGGYVKLVGMLPPAPEDEPGRLRGSNTGMFTQLVSDARASEYELVQPGDEDRLFYKLASWKKVVVMASGATVNLVLAFVLFGGVFMLHGAPTATTTIDEVADCVIAATPETVNQGQRRCTPADPVAPAREAGLRAGDRLVAFNGTRVTSWEQLTRLIRANRDGAASIVVERDGRMVTTRTNTTVSPRPLSSQNPERIVEVGFLGVEPTVVPVRQDAGFVVSFMAEATWDTLGVVAQFPVKVWHVARAAVGLEERAPDSPMSVVGASRVAGQVASAEESPLGDRFITLVMLLGGVNLFVGMLNFVPLLPLDGGHIAGAVYEAARRRLAKLLPVAYVMAAVFVVLTVVLVFADIVAPVQVG